MIVRSTLRRGAYYDSVTLMRVQQDLRSLPGIEEAGVVMGTEANLDLLRQAGLDVGEIVATPIDLVVAVRADTAAHAASALAALDALLLRRPEGAGDAAYRPRTPSAAARMLSGANLALISVPGRFAAGVAREALRSGLHVMLFSDNVPVADEVRLKQMGQSMGLLVMGPDCGTALIGGVALGFANRVRRGPVGLVGAAGTGLQEVASLIHRNGGGISHALGTGGRDLMRSVGGLTMRRGPTLLEQDAATTVVGLVSKPPDPEVAGRLLRQAAGINKPVVAAFVGARPPAPGGDPLRFAATLEDAALLAVRLAGGAPRKSDEPLRGWPAEIARRARPEAERLASSQRFLRGLYSGGTLCAECVGLLEPVLRPVYTNVPVGAARALGGVGPSQAHTVLDLGDDLFTVGRLHPMLDMTLRSQRLRQEAADPEVAVVLLDVVLGEGVHPDPAGALIPAITAARDAAAAAGRFLPAGGSGCGTDEDPQNRSRQVERLEAAGVLVEGSNARAAQLAGAIAARGAEIPETSARGGSRASPAVPAGASEERLPAPSEGEARLLAGPLRVVTAGLPVFPESLRAQGVEVIDLDWRPPAEGEQEMLELLERLG